MFIFLVLSVYYFAVIHYNSSNLAAPAAHFLLLFLTTVLGSLLFDFCEELFGLLCALVN